MKEQLAPLDACSCGAGMKSDNLRAILPLGKAEWRDRHKVGSAESLNC